MGGLIEYLAKEGRKISSKNSDCTSQSSLSESDLGDSDEGAEASGYETVKVILKDIYAEIFQSERMDEQLKQELLPKVLTQMV